MSARSDPVSTLCVYVTCVYALEPVLQCGINSLRGGGLAIAGLLPVALLGWLLTISSRGLAILRGLLTITCGRLRRLLIALGRLAILGRLTVAGLAGGLIHHYSFGSSGVGSEELAQCVWARGAGARLYTRGCQTNGETAHPLPTSLGTPLEGRPHH